MAGEPNAKIGLTLRLPERLRAQLEAESQASLSSLNNEIVRRLENSFDNETLLRALLDRSRSTDMIKGLHAVTDKVARVARTMLELEQYFAMSPQQARDHELNTRREIQAACAVILAVYAATEERRPRDLTNSDIPAGAWGTGDHGRRYAYAWLDWQDDYRLDRAKGVEIDAYWTGDLEILAPLDLSPEETEWRRHQGRAPKSLAEIMARNSDGTYKNPAAMKEAVQASNAKRKAAKTKS